MNKQIVTGLALTMFLVGILASAFSIRQIKASETIYIRADGSVDPSATPIMRSGDVYTFNDSIEDSIVVQRSNIVIDGAGHDLEGMLGGTGISLSDIQNVTIKNVTIKTFDKGIHLERCSICNITLTNVTMSYSYGVYVVRSSNNNIAKNNISSNNVIGILLDTSTSNRISGNNITRSTYEGISLYSSSDNNMSENSVTNSINSGALSLYTSSNNIISANDISNNRYGILLSLSSKNNSMSGNKITDNSYGVRLQSSSNNNDLRGNDIRENDEGIVVDDSYSNSITENSVLSNRGWSIGLFHSSNYCSMVNNSIANSGLDGIFVNSSSHNTISGNKITNSTMAGIFLDYSSNTNIVGNNITHSHEGINLTTSSSNYIIANNIGNNSIGMGCKESSNSAVYHNNFENNTDQAYVENSVNVWDNGYVSGGNHWDDYDGTDKNCSEEQCFDGSDMIGDTPYVIGAENKDKYPLMKPWPSPLPSLWFENYSVQVISNSSIAEFNFDRNLGQIRFNATTDAPDSCRVIVSKSLLDGAFNFLVDNVSAACCISWSPKCHMINFNYSEGSHIVRVAGEFVERPPLREFPDLNGDRIVDIYDAIILASNWGKQL